MNEKSKKPKVPASCVKFSESEYKKVQDSSEVTGKTIPTLLKEAFFKGGVVKPKFSDEEAKNLLKQLNRIGNNINQIARHLNFGISEIWAVDFEKVKKEFLEIKKILSEREASSACT